MSSDEIAIRVENLGKCYQIYERPQDRLKQSIVPRLTGNPGRKYYREFWALHDASFEIRKGETMGIIGRNGSGKSTLLQIICGTLSPTRGTVQVNGRVAALLELGAGFNPEFTGRENVYMNGALLGLTRAGIDERFEDIAAFADIGEFIERPVKMYSSGMFVRLAFATAINVNPDILIVDEALSVGDEAFQRKCFARIEKIQEGGGTILFVSHSGQTIIQLCSRALLVDAGELLLEGEPKRVVGWYQRFVHADEDKARMIREEIKGLALTGSDEVSLKGNKEDMTSPCLLSSSSKAKIKARFDPNLRPETLVEYTSKHAQIFDVKLLDAEGRVVNELVHGDNYRLEYKVAFEAAFPRVAFGMAIKTVNGVEIGGQGSHHLGAGISVGAGDIVDVSFPFVNLLLPGTYFCNAGVSSHGQSSFEQLHRLLDASVFRVLPEVGDRPVSCIVNLVPSDGEVLIARMARERSECA